MITFFHDQHLLFCLFILISSFAISIVVIPSIIQVARTRHLYDDMGNFRKIHNPGIPRLGGGAIFVSFAITLLLAGLSNQNLPINYILISCILLFAIGIKDDLTGVGHQSKFFMEFLATAVLVVPGDIRIRDLHNIFGIHELSYIASITLSMLIIIFIINSLNLIDGIDGLAASTGIMTNLVFSGLFLLQHQYELATVSITMAGALLGFLKYNLSPAKVFMGDTGSLLTGLITAIMAIKYIEVSSVTNLGGGSAVSSSPGIALAILIGPVTDTCRVFFIRLYQRKSPFLGDRNHIHHRILNLGFTHLQTTGILILLNALIIVLAFLCSGYGNMMIILVIVLTVFVFNQILHLLMRFKNKKSTIQAEDAINESYKYN